jgi:hypothetical protein
MAVATALFFSFGLSPQLLGLSSQLRAPTSVARIRTSPHAATMVTQDARKIILEDEVDEEKMLAASTFPIKPDELINRAKEIIRAQRGIQDGSFDENLLAPDFRFCAPFVGGATPKSPEDAMPGLPKDQYLAALRSFDLLTAFPDMNNNYHAFRVDPFEPNRVWFQTRAVATHTGKLMGKPATGKKLVLPPQAFSLTFNEAGQVTLFNVGYVIDRTIGNTGGLGGAFGFFWGTGNPLPFPECKPYKPSLQMRSISLVQKLLNLLSGKRK